MSQRKQRILTRILDRETVWETLINGLRRGHEKISEDDPRLPGYRRMAEVGIRIAQDRLQGLVFATSREGIRPCEHDTEDVKQEYALIRALLESADEPAETQARD